MVNASQKVRRGVGMAPSGIFAAMLGGNSKSALDMTSSQGRRGNRPRRYLRIFNCASAPIHGLKLEGGQFLWKFFVVNLNFTEIIT